MSLMIGLGWKSIQMWCEEVRDNVVGREKGFTYIYIYIYIYDYYENTYILIHKGHKKIFRYVNLKNRA